MQRVLTGYAVYYNRRHRRSGHLLGNRFKSTLVDKEAYFLELVRYIHLNPVRAGLVKDMRALERFAWTGHRTLVGKVDLPWQEVLGQFGKRINQA